MRAVLDSFLAVLPPSVAVVQLVNLALCHECKPWLPLPLLVLLLRFQPNNCCQNQFKHAIDTITYSTKETHTPNKKVQGARKLIDCFNSAHPERKLKCWKKGGRFFVLTSIS